MTGGEAQVVVAFGACMVAIPIVVVGWMRARGPLSPRQHKADERAARRACAPQRPHVVAAPIHCPVSALPPDVDLPDIDELLTRGFAPIRELEPAPERIERVVDVINGGRA